MSLKEFLQNKLVEKQNNRTADSAGQLLEIYESNVGITNNEGITKPFYMIEDNYQRDNYKLVTDLVGSLDKTFEDELFRDYVNSMKFKNNKISRENKQLEESIGTDDLAKENSINKSEYELSTTEEQVVFIQDYPVEIIIDGCYLLRDLEDICSKYTSIKMTEDRFLAIIESLISRMSDLCSKRFMMYFGKALFIEECYDSSESLGNFLRDVVSKFNYYRMNVTKTDFNSVLLSDAQKNDYKDYVSVESSILGKILVDMVDKAIWTD